MELCGKIKIREWKSGIVFYVTNFLLFHSLDSFALNSLHMFFLEDLT